MSLPDIHILYEVIDSTWPAARQWQEGGFLLRDGKGGGKRVCAATLDGELADADLSVAEAAMRAIGQIPLFQLRAGEEALDNLLDAAGYQAIDHVNIYAMPAADLATERPPRTVAIPTWEPLKIMEEIWAKGGIGPERIAVMHRGCRPKTGILSRFQDKPAGATYVGLHNGISMVHALEVLPQMRRNGLAQWVMRQAAFWTLENSGHTVSVVTTQDNVAANRLYSGLGMTVIGQYHYRIQTEALATCS